MTQSQLKALPELASLVESRTWGLRAPQLRAKISELAALVFAGSCLLSAQALASGLPSGPSVGEVSMVLGKAWVESGGGRQRVIEGTPVHVHDKIVTSGSGHVHIRFKDNALVSIRPESLFEIDRYDYDPANPGASVVKFNVQDGVVRAISGEAAREARENFRLNTPIAAIGVRGTDFVVSASAQTVRAQVNEGTIVVAPYSMDCAVEAFGPCRVSNAMELTGAGNQIVEVRTDALNPVLLPGPDSAALPQQPPVVQRAAAAAPIKEAEQTAEDPYVSSVASRAVNTKLTVSTTAVPPQAGSPSQPLPPVFTPAAPVAPQALTNRQLVWGRWSNSTQVGANERITVSYDIATADNRKITIRDDRGLYALFRTENGPNIVQHGLGVVGFALNQAQATYSQNGVGSLMSVSKGALSIDFNQSRFTTSLDLNHAATGPVTFSDSGMIFHGGYFHSRNPGQVMAGAVSLDGAEAGYFFEKTLQNGGLIEGITLWGRLP